MDGRGAGWCVTADEVRAGRAAVEVAGRCAALDRAAVPDADVRARETGELDGSVVGAEVEGGGGT